MRHKSADGIVGRDAGNGVNARRRQIDRETEIQTDRQTDTQTDRQTDRQTDTQTDRQT